MKTLTALNSFDTYPTLVKLLDKNKSFALNARGTTNHCPMALTALAAMGASSQRLEEFFIHWQEQYALPAMQEEGEPIVYAEALTHLGNRAYFAKLQTSFAERIAVAGKTQVLSEMLAALPFAPASAAFHALIRLAYGLQAEHGAEIAAGLAALVVANFDIALNYDGRAQASSVAAGFSHLAHAMDGKKFPGRMITEKMLAVSTDAQFLAAFQGVPESENILDELALWAIAAYWHTRDFTILHIVTGINAARMVLPYVNAQQMQARVEELWLALCVAYVSVGAPAIPNLPACLSKAAEQYASLAEWPEDWSKLFEQAIHSNDDHVIKFTYTSYRENQLRPNILYVAAVMDMLKEQAESGM